MKNSTMLSIIIPCYNVSDTIERAIDSILFQKINFQIEIICVDDKSTDDTIDKIAAYIHKYSFIKLIQNNINKGNAETFFNGLKHANGKYFAVLDGDDFYTFRDKLQKQVDFLEQDRQHEYCAVTHYYITYKNDGTIFVPNFNPTVTEYTYKDFLNLKINYHHTSTYVFRNIYKKNPPEILKKDALRGDMPRVFFELVLTNKKIKVLNFFGSAYHYTLNGIWTSLDYKKQIERNISYCTAIKELVNSKYEKKCMAKWINHFQNSFSNNSSSFDPTPQGKSKDCIIDDISKAAAHIAFSDDCFSFHSIYRSTIYDSLCATLGYIQLLELNIDILKNRELDQNTIMIIINDLIPDGGGIFTELSEIIDIFQDKNVVIFCTKQSPLDDNIKNYLKNHKNCTIIKIPKDASCRIKYAFEQIIKHSPYRVYFYVGHYDALINWLAQPALSENIHIFSYDHGFVLGIGNPNYSNFIVKRKVDTVLLKNSGIQDIVYIPVWSKTVCSTNKYVAFNQHKEVITASAAARWYKCDGQFPYNYIKLILDSLLHTNGKHIHYGPIPDDALSYIRDFILQNGLSDSQFVNIPWAEDLPASLIENHVDIFIEPFPIVSAKISIAVQSVGIPILKYAGTTRLTIADFTYEEALTWTFRKDFIKTLKNISKYELEKQSEFSFNDFKYNHSFESIAENIRKNQCIPVTNFPDFIDDYILDHPVSNIFLESTPSVKRNWLYQNMERYTPRLYHYLKYIKNNFLIRLIKG